MQSGMLVQTAAVENGVYHPAIYMVVMLALALIPLLAIGATSFVKLSVVFSVLRNAIGGGQLPPAGLTSLLATALTFAIMAPVGRDMFQEAEQVIAPSSQRIPATFVGPVKTAKVRPADVSTVKKKASGEKFGANPVRDLAVLVAVVKKAVWPLQLFLARHARYQDRVFFNRLTTVSTAAPEQRETVRRELLASANCLGPASGNACALADETIFSLIPAFMTSELHRAFQIGFMLFVPFLIIDLIVTNLLVALGMSMVSPVTVALPIKLLLFVGCNGWFLLCRSLVMSYF